MTLRYIKDGVKFDNCKPELVNGIIIVTLALLKYNYDCVITSGSDGIHPAGGEHDPHYLGYAFDLRTRDFKVQDVPTVVRDLRLVLGPGWVVVQEADHIHCQCQRFKDPLAVQFCIVSALEYVLLVQGCQFA